jgi:hypothetical protein
MATFILFSISERTTIAPGARMRRCEFDLLRCAVRVKPPELEYALSPMALFANEIWTSLGQFCRNVCFGIGAKRAPLEVPIAAVSSESDESCTDIGIDEEGIASGCSSTKSQNESITGQEGLHFGGFCRSFASLLLYFR